MSPPPIPNFTSPQSAFQAHVQKQNDKKREPKVAKRLSTHFTIVSDSDEIGAGPDFRGRIIGEVEDAESEIEMPRRNFSTTANVGRTRPVVEAESEIEPPRRNFSTTANVGRSRPVVHASNNEEAGPGPSTMREQMRERAAKAALQREKELAEEVKQNRAEYEKQKREQEEKGRLKRRPKPIPSRSKGKGKQRERSESPVARRTTRRESRTSVRRKRRYNSPQPAQQHNEDSDVESYTSHTTSKSFRESVKDMLMRTWTGRPRENDVEMDNIKRPRKSVRWSDAEEEDRARDGDVANDSQSDDNSEDTVRGKVDYKPKDTKFQTPRKPSRKPPPPPKNKNLFSDDEDGEPKMSGALGAGDRSQRSRSRSRAEKQSRSEAEPKGKGKGKATAFDGPDDREDGRSRDRGREKYKENTKPSGLEKLARSLRELKILPESDDLPFDTDHVYDSRPQRLRRPRMGQRSKLSTELDGAKEHENFYDPPAPKPQPKPRPRSRERERTGRSGVDHVYDSHASEPKPRPRSRERTDRPGTNHVYDPHSRYGKSRPRSPLRPPSRSTSPSRPPPDPARQQRNPNPTDADDEASGSKGSGTGSPLTSQSELERRAQRERRRMRRHARRERRREEGESVSESQEDERYSVSYGPRNENCAVM